MAAPAAGAAAGGVADLSWTERVRARLSAAAAVAGAAFGARRRHGAGGGGWSGTAARTSEADI